MACLKQWGSGKPDPNSDPEYSAKHAAMMKKYGPLPDGWQEKYDPGTGRHYYWCPRSDRVSWLPPGHPKAKVTEPASRVREFVQQENVSDEEEEEDSDAEAMDLDSDMVRTMEGFEVVHRYN